MFSSRLVLSLPQVVTLIDGSSNVIYENGTAKRLLTDEGYVDLTTNTYYYYLKDHQGNNRVVINSSGTVQETNHYYPFGGLFATNGSVQPYKYNGKELDTKGGLNLYDYGARHYDAAIGRWHVVDPSSEKYGMWSPYSYCKDNPIIRIDVDGKDDYILTSTGKLYIDRVTNSATDKVTFYRTNNFVTINDKSLLPKMIEHQKDWTTGYSTFGDTENLKDAATLFKFAADNTNVEWKLDVYNENNNTTAIVITDHNSSTVQSGDFAKKQTGTMGDKIIDIHSHPSPNSKGASSEDKQNTNAKYNAVYFKNDNTLREYDSQSTSTVSVNMNTTEDLQEYIIERVEK